MLRIRVLTTILLFLTAAAISPVVSAEEVPAPPERQKRAELLEEYNGKTADKRLGVIGKLDNCKEQRSIETLYLISRRDSDPEVRSRAFAAMVHCEDTYGYTAYLAADSFKGEKDIGVKVEKAVEMGSLRYKWAALNELVGFMRTLRWTYWPIWLYGRTAGYIAAGNPGGETIQKKSGSEYDEWRNREPIRWRTENELIGIIAGIINRMAGTRIESRPRINQEIVSWWERKSDLWLEYDRKLREKAVIKPKVQKTNEDKEENEKIVQPEKNNGAESVLELLMGESKTAKPQEAVTKTTKPAKANNDVDE